MICWKIQKKVFKKLFRMLLKWFCSVSCYVPVHWLLQLKSNKILSYNKFKETRHYVRMVVIISDINSTQTEPKVTIILIKSNNTGIILRPQFVH